MQDYEEFKKENYKGKNVSEEEMFLAYILKLSEEINAKSEGGADHRFLVQSGPRP